jgi:hypothetical protein
MIPMLVKNFEIAGETMSAGPYFNAEVDIGSIASNLERQADGI